jgi:hypothetical protein
MAYLTGNRENRPIKQSIEKYENYLLFQSDSFLRSATPSVSVLPTFKWKKPSRGIIEIE